MPDERLGEVIHAVVVAKAGRMVRGEDLRAWLAARIERYKIPDVIEIASDLPTGSTGKASRKALVEQVLSKGGIPE